MYFLIDFENVNYAGLEGLEYLDKDDTLIIFYSAACDKIKEYRLQQIINSGCNWEINRLARTGKNALDFYIATSVGEIFSTDSNATIGIVSSDKGFRAVKDYWKSRLNPKNRLVQGNSVAVCMSHGHDTTRRRSVVRKQNSTVDIKEQHSKYIENRRIELSLKAYFGETEYAAIIPQIMNIIKNEKNPKAVYLATLKSFGKKAGLQVYRTLKLLPEYQVV